MKRLAKEVAGSELSPEIRKEADGQLESLKTMLAQQRAAEQQLRSQESELAAVIAAEQNRWTEFNARLDEIERALPKPTPR